MIQKNRLCCLSHGSIITCFILLFLNIVVVPVIAQSGGLKVIVNNERESGEVCVSSGSKTLPCKNVNRGDSEVFQFAPNAIPVGEEFQVCRDEFCITGSNGPENEPEYVTLLTRYPEPPSDTSQPQVDVQPSDTSSSFPTRAWTSFWIITSKRWQVDSRGRSQLLLKRLLKFGVTSTSQIYNKLF